MNDNAKIFFVGFVSSLLMIMAGCISIKTQEEIAVKKIPKVVRQGIYHKVKKGETLWRIAKTYKVSISDIAQANKIPKAAKIEKNQLVFIPGANKALNISQDVDQAQNEFVWPIIIT